MELATLIGACACRVGCTLRDLTADLGQEPDLGHQRSLMWEVAQTAVVMIRDTPEVQPLWSECLAILRLAANSLASLAGIVVLVLANRLVAVPRGASPAAICRVLKQEPEAVTCCVCQEQVQGLQSICRQCGHHTCYTCIHRIHQSLGGSWKDDVRVPQHCPVCRTPAIPPSR